MRHNPFSPAAVLVLATIAITAQGQAPAPAQSFDLLIKNARVFDGTGNPAFPADVGAREGRIVAVGRLGTATATRVIDATGKYVTPGFIDIHSHADDGSRARGGFRDENPQVRAAPTWSPRESRPSSSITTADRRGRSRRSVRSSRGTGSVPTRC